MRNAGTITAQFVTEKSVGSATICWLTESRISHVDVVVDEATVAKYVPIAKVEWKTRLSLRLHGYALLGARLSGGVALRPWNYERFTFTERRTCTVPNIDAAYSFLFAQIGKPYNWQAIVDFVFHKLHMGEKFDRMQQRSWFCDELLYATCAAGGVDLLDCGSPKSLTPQMVLLSPKLAPVAVTPTRTRKK